MKQKAEARDETAGRLHGGGARAHSPQIRVAWARPWPRPFFALENCAWGLLRGGRGPQGTSKNFAGVMLICPALVKNWFEPQVSGDPDSGVCRQRGRGLACSLGPHPSALLGPGRKRGLTTATRGALRTQLDLLRGAGKSRCNAVAF